MQLARFLNKLVKHDVDILHKAVLYLQKNK